MLQYHLLITSIVFYLGLIFANTWSNKPKSNQKKYFCCFNFLGKIYHLVGWVFNRVRQKWGHTKAPSHIIVLAALVKIRTMHCDKTLVDFKYTYFTSLVAHRFGRVKFWILNISYCFLQAGAFDTSKSIRYQWNKSGAWEMAFSKIWQHLPLKCPVQEHF